MDIFAFLKNRFPRLKTERNFSFAKHTTIGVGGDAAVAVYPASTEEAAELLAVLRREKIPYCFLGAGANVLPRDGQFEGAVVRFTRIDGLYADGNLLYAGAGVTGGALCRFAAARLLGGVEFLTGIPMTVGGATAMNAGVREGHMSDVILRVVGVEEGKIRTFSASDCAFREKDSVFLGGIAVTGVYLGVKESVAEQIARESCYFRTRRAALPKGRSMGCVFVNPQGESAGRLIEQCGLKDARIGGAYISELHANFILSDGKSAEDVARLIDLAARTVKEKTGIALREEIRRLP